ncbi:MAG: hypothetical protein BGO31_14320 [Bacteroidetes bacterium 43-16]|nr:MAG: hypothetical protein BGO31_14320 [Bacteroidetes bacterium 43-16]
METSNQEIQVVPTSAIELITKAEIDMQITTAKAYPRSIKTFLDKAESLATISEDVAQSCIYTLPRGNKQVEGPSVRFAEIICSTYGNIRAGARVIANDGKTITAQGICHDLETNNSATVEVKRKITDKNGRTYNEDMQTVTGNAACSIAYRNAVLKVVTTALVSGIYEKVKEVARGTAETLTIRRDKAINYLKSLNVTEKQILQVLELKKIQDIDLDKLSVLRGMVTLILNGESTVKDLFEEPTGADKKENLKAAQGAGKVDLP